MADELWYSPIDCLPHLRVMVFAIFADVEIRAVRLQKKGKTKKIVWATYSNGKPHYFSEDPSCWRPLYPELYQGPLVNGFVRDAPPKIYEPLPSREREWWRDDRAVRYSLPGSVTPKEAEGRVMRALWAETAFERADTLYSATPLSWLARMIEIAEMAAGKRASYWHDRFQPTGADLKDFTVIIGWLRQLPDDFYTVLRMRAENPAYSFVEIAHELGVSSTTAHVWYRTAIGYVTRAANGQPVPATTHAARRARDKKAGVASYAAAG